QSKLLLSPSTAHLTDNHQSSMDAHTESKLATPCLLQTLIQVFYGIEDTQARAYCSVSIIFMCLGIPKVHEETIPKELGDVPVIALNHLRTGSLIRTDYVPVLFGVKLRRKLGGIDQVAEHHRELPSFRVGRRSSRERCDLQGGLMLGSRRLCWLGRLSD